MLSVKVPFRYDNPRQGQEKLIEDAFHALQDGKTFLAHAETGLGKTDSSLSAALGVALASEPRKTVIFLTPKNAQHKIAMDALKEINKKFGLELKAVDLVGKKHMCIDEQTSQKEGRMFYEFCRKKREYENCEFYKNARGHTTLQKEKATIARKNFTTTMKGVHDHAELIAAAATNTMGGESFGLCPFEMTMELAKKADVIIADYYHVFSPSVSEQVLPKLGKKLENCILIVDEAHNLPERVRGLQSKTLTTRQLQKAMEEAEFLGENELYTFLHKMNESLKTNGKRGGPKEYLLSAHETVSFFEKKENMPWEEHGLECELRGVDYLEKSQKESSALLQVGEFLEKWDAVGEDRVRILKPWHIEGEYSISLKVLDPKPLTQPILEKVSGSILMSGTLFPIEMYADLFGIKKENLRTGFYASPFPQENRVNVIVPNHTTKFTERSEAAYEKIAEETGKIVNQIPGNTIVFFPSFKMLDDIGRKVQDYTIRPILFQRENMKVHETQNVLNKFREYGNGFGSVLLACTQGSFGEGIDLPGNQLLGVIIVGIPLAEMNTETKALIDYYEKKFQRGWKYGYIYPAMGKAIQAAGRVIRSPEDAGAIVFMDKRYAWDNYKECLPPTQKYVSAADPATYIGEFWKARRSQ